MKQGRQRQRNLFSWSIRHRRSRKTQEKSLFLKTITIKEVQVNLRELFWHCRMERAKAMSTMVDAKKMCNRHLDIHDKSKHEPYHWKHGVIQHTYTYKHTAAHVHTRTHTHNCTHTHTCAHIVALKLTKDMLFNRCVDWMQVKHIKRRSRVALAEGLREQSLHVHTPSIS